MERSSRHEPPFSIVCLSSQEWRAALPTNRQQIMLRAARRGHAVLFVETGYFAGRHLRRLVRGPGRRSLLSRLVATEAAAERVRVRKALNLLPWGVTFRLANAVNCRATARLLRRLTRRLPQPVVLWIYDPGAARTIGACGETFAVYDCVDDYVEQTASHRKRVFAAAADRLAARRSRLVFATSRTVQERHLGVNPATHLVPNGGDYPHFSPAADRATAAPEVAGLPRPVVGFAGNFLPSKVDFALLERLAASRPEWTLLLIGPAGGDSLPVLRSLAARPNVRWLGPKGYDELPGYIAAFDVGLIPYVSNAYTRSCRPLKLFEYLAAGKPVVASGLPELADMQPDVLLVDGAAAVVEAIEAALGRRGPADVERRTALASRNTWETRTERLLQLVAAELTA